MEKNIPLYEFIIDEELLAKGEFNVNPISIVDEPAILVDFLKFNTEEPIQFKIENKEKRELLGVAMIPGMRIYRVDAATGQEYYGYFSKETINKWFEFNMKTGAINNFSFMHNGESIQGCFVKEAWLTGNIDKSQEFGFNLPAGSLMVNVKCSEEVWQVINEKGLKGFSIECFADAIPVQFNKACNITKEQVQLAKIKKALAEAELNTLKLSSETEVEYWSKKCRCSNCRELKALGWNLPGILPESEHKRKHKVI